MENDEWRVQAEQLAKVMDMLLTMMEHIGSAFAQQQLHLLDNLEKQQQNVIEEIAFDAAQADQQMVGRRLRSRRPFFLYQSIMSHLLMVARALVTLAEAPREQIRGAILFSDGAVEQIHLLFRGQTEILRNLAETVRTGEPERLKDLSKACLGLSRLCQPFASRHESRLLRGLCLPKAAPLFLSIIDQTQTLVHHHREIVKLLARWFKYHR